LAGWPISKRREQRVAAPNGRQWEEKQTGTERLTGKTDKFNGGWLG